MRAKIVIYSKCRINHDSVMSAYALLIQLKIMSLPNAGRCTRLHT